MFRLANHLRQHGYHVKCLWAWNDYDTKIEQHIKPGLLMIGLSATVLSRRDHEGNLLPLGIPIAEFNQRCRRWKELAPGCKIVVGGGQIAYMNDEQLRRLIEVDYFVTGQGESSGVHLLDRLKSKSAPRTKTIEPPVILDDRTHGYQEFSSSVNTWAPEDAVQPGEPLPLEIARGCIFHCSFCQYDILGKKANDFTRHPTLIEQELRRNYEFFGTQDYTVLDDLINDSEEKVDSIYDITQRLGFPIRFIGYARLDLFRRFPETIKKLKASGLYGAIFGIESVNDASARAVGKGLGISRIQEGLDAIAEVYDDRFLGLACMILGLPHDNGNIKHDVMTWIRDPKVNRVIKNLSVQALTINTRQPYSDIEKDPNKFGYTIERRSRSNIRAAGMEWKLPDYDIHQAQEDARWIYQEMSRFRPWNRAFSIWSVPWLIRFMGDADRAIDLLASDSENADIDEINRFVEDIKEQFLDVKSAYIKDMEKFA